MKNENSLWEGFKIKRAFYGFTQHLLNAHSVAGTGLDAVDITVSKSIHNLNYWWVGQAVSHVAILFSLPLSLLEAETVPNYCRLAFFFSLVQLVLSIEREIITRILSIFVAKLPKLQFWCSNLTLSRCIQVVKCKNRPQI